ncbi:MAG: glycosyltransferase family 4 protein [Solirubrobacteraceae bacterium]
MDGQSGLTIGIDARAAAEVKAGRGRLVRELLRALANRDEDHRYLLYAREPWPEMPHDNRFAWRTIGGRDPLWHAHAAWAAGRECDVLLSSNSYLTPLLTRIPSVAIVYDLIAFEPAMRPNRRSSIIERATLGAAVRRCSALLAISQATADSLTDRFPRARGRTVVASLGVTPTLSVELDPAETSALPAPGFVLAVGTLEPRKNLPRLVRAYQSLDGGMQREHPLVVVGALGWETGETVQALRMLGERCIMLGHVSDAVLAELYRRCAVFCYPSLGEGFGLPVLEAMAAGAPVLTSNVSSLPEVGGDAVEYADPRSDVSIAGGLRLLLSDEPFRMTLGQRAIARANEFSWEQFGETVLRSLEQVTRSG